MEALMEATTKSKYSIFVMGYASPQPYTCKTHGFDATLGAMEGAGEACWHIYKKGFCRHGDSCVRQHPLELVSVEVFVESARLDAPEYIAKSFQMQVYHAAMEVVSQMQQSRYVDNVVASKDEERQAWTIEIQPRQNFALRTYHDSVITSAQNAVFFATGRPKTPYIFGYAIKPFRSIPGGFVTILVDALDKHRACWKYYSQGYCPRTSSECQWDHSTCSMPLTLVIRET
jgi:hypothetical protein